MKVVIDIPKDFEGDYIADKFKDFFSRVIADIDCKGMCGRYEKEIAEMFLKAFEESEEKMKCDECKNANICLDHREEETLVGCTSGIPDRKVHTNADRIRNMSDEELAKWFDTVTKDVLGGSSWDKDGWLKWLQTENEV